MEELIFLAALIASLCICGVVCIIIDHEEEKRNDKYIKRR